MHTGAQDLQVNEDPHPKILLIEDDAFLRELIIMGLEVENYRVITTGDGKEGKHRLEAGLDPDLIILDLFMPNLDGLKFLCWAREDKGLAMPIIVLSAGNDEEYIQKAHQFGADEFLFKPLDLDALKQVIKKYLRMG